MSSDNPYALEDGVSAGDNLEPEVKQALENATDLELTDLAAVLGTRGFHNSRNIRKCLSSLFSRLDSIYYIITNSSSLD